MRLSHPAAQLFVPDGTPLPQALARLTHVGVGAHPDDLEFMAWHPVLECFHDPDRWFGAITVTAGRGSSRTRMYADYTDEDMARVRLQEQKRAALIGEYGALVWLDFTSDEVRAPGAPQLVEDLVTLLEGCQARAVYTHNLADKHDTHVAVALAVVAALRRLPPERRPARLYGCEVWRSLDWLVDEDKVAFDVSAHENLTLSLMGVYDSQIAGGKRYDLATLGRKRANATYWKPRTPDAATAVEFAMDMTALLTDPDLDPLDFVTGLIERFRQDVAARVRRFR
ncbi:MAG TPA: PIG-L family deacetylase [Candidatus Nitrosotenuis sp.]|nr:PIG-L family deacetylase [Candidatus Nitrosotenuis sp.]